MHDTMAVYMTVDDPEGLSPVANAYCTLTEVHTNFKTKSLIAIFECCRSREAFLAKRKAFTAIQLQFEPNTGGEEFFNQYGVDGSGLVLGPNIKQFAMERALEGAILVDEKTASDVAKGSSFESA